MKYEWIDEFLLAKKGVSKDLKKRMELDTLSDRRQDVCGDLFG